MRTRRFETVRTLAVAAVVLLVVLHAAGCGGGSSNSGIAPVLSAGSTDQAITGTVATGLAVANGRVSVVDSAGQSVGTAVTGVDGRYSVSMPSGSFTPPFFVRVTPEQKQPALYAVGDGPVINVTSLSTFVLQQYYLTLGTTRPAARSGDARPDYPWLAASANPGTYGLPSASSLSSGIWALIQSVAARLGLPSDFDPVSGAFTAATSAGASGSAFDAVLDSCTISAATSPGGTSTLTFQVNGQQWTVTLTAQAGAGSTPSTRSVVFTGTLAFPDGNGGTTTTPIQFSLPAPLTAASNQIDPTYTFWVTDWGFGDMRKLDPVGAEILLARHVTIGTPSGIAYDSSKNLYVCDATYSAIVKISRNGSGSTFVNSGLDYPTGIAFDASDNLYVANLNTNTVSKVTPSGSVSTFASGLRRPQGLAFDASGNLYVANSENGTVSRVTPSGSVSYFVSGFRTPVGLAFDASGILYVSDITNGAVYKVTPSGSVSLFAGGFNEPAGLAFYEYGNLFVVNSGSGTISTVTPGGGVRTFCDGFNHPLFLALGPQIY